MPKQEYKNDSTSLWSWIITYCLTVFSVSTIWWIVMNPIADNLSLTRPEMIYVYHQPYYTYFITTVISQFLGMSLYTIIVSIFPRSFSSFFAKLILGLLCSNVYLTVLMLATFGIHFSYPPAMMAFVMMSVAGAIMPFIRAVVVNYMTQSKISQ